MMMIIGHKWHIRRHLEINMNKYFNKDNSYDFIDSRLGNHKAYKYTYNSIYICNHTYPLNNDDEDIDDDDDAVEQWKLTVDSQYIHINIIIMTRNHNSKTVFIMASNWLIKNLILKINK